MGLIRSLFPRREKAVIPLIQEFLTGHPQFPNLNYQVLAREGYSRNELVFACIEELSTSAAEPELMVRRGRTWSREAPILDLLNRPNPFMSRFDFFSTVIMHRSVAGNAYALKVRSGSGKVVELWLLRPDRVRVIPDAQRFIARYEYDIGGNPVPIPVNDIIHFKTRNPLDDFYGLAPLAVAAGRVAVDNFQRDFVRKFFESAGVPAGLLSTKQRLSDDAKKEIKSRYREDYGGRSGWHNLMVLDGADATFTAMTANLGNSGLVLPNLDEINEARIAMCFGVPLTIIGARLGVNSSSYANKRSDRESFWDEELAPIYVSLAGALNLSLKPDFVGVDEVKFDLSTVKALQPDMDQIHARWRADYNSGVVTLEETREALGLKPIEPGTLLVPSNLTPVTYEVLTGVAEQGPQQASSAPLIPAQGTDTGVG